MRFNRRAGLKILPKMKPKLSGWLTGNKAISAAYGTQRVLLSSYYISTKQDNVKWALIARKFGEGK
jgi:hypothetical protein